MTYFQYSAVRLLLSYVNGTSPRAALRGLAENDHVNCTILHVTYSPHILTTATSTSTAPDVRLIPRLHDQANIQQIHSKYTCATCALTARYLLDVCLIIAWSRKRGINGPFDANSPAQCCCLWAGRTEKNGYVGLNAMLVFLLRFKTIEDRVLI